MYKVSALVPAPFATWTSERAVDHGAFPLAEKERAFVARQHTFLLVARPPARPRASTPQPFTQQGPRELANVSIGSPGLFGSGENNTPAFFPYPPARPAQKVWWDSQ